jgi:hypothetical protein
MNSSVSVINTDRSYCGNEKAATTAWPIRDIMRLSEEVRIRKKSSRAADFAAKPNLTQVAERRHRA